MSLFVGNISRHASERDNNWLCPQSTMETEGSDAFFFFQEQTAGQEGHGRQSKRK